MPRAGTGTLKERIEAVTAQVTTSKGNIKLVINGDNTILISTEQPTFDEIVEALSLAKTNMKNIINAIGVVTITEEPSIDFTEYIRQSFNAQAIYQTEVIASTQNWVCPTGVTSVDVYLFSNGNRGKENPKGFEAGDNVGDFINSKGNGGSGGTGGLVYLISNLSVSPGTSYSCIIAGQSESIQQSTFNGNGGSVIVSSGGTGARGGISVSGGNTGAAGENVTISDVKNGNTTVSALVSPGGPGGNVNIRWGSGSSDYIKANGGAAGVFSFTGIGTGYGQGGQGQSVGYRHALVAYTITLSGPFNGNAGAIFLVYKRAI